MITRGAILNCKVRIGFSEKVICEKIHEGPG